MLRDKYPDIYQDAELLETYSRRIIYNYGIDIGMFRGVPLAFDCKYEPVQIADEWNSKMKRLKTIDQVATLELIFTYSSGDK